MNTVQHEASTRPFAPNAAHSSSARRHLAGIAGRLLGRPEQRAIARAASLGLAIALLCTRSMWADGYLMQTDSVYGPRAGLGSPSYFTPISAVFYAIHWLGGGAWAGRVFVLAALVLCCAGPMVLLRSLPWFAQCTAGLLGVFNPWVYDRGMDGQWGIAAAAGMLFLWLAAWEWMLEDGRRRTVVCTVAAGVATVALSSHFAALLAVLIVASVVRHRLWHPGPRRGRAAIAVGCTALLLLYGAIPFFFGGGPRSYAQVRTFGEADLRLFSSSPAWPGGLWPNLLGLGGYWAEKLMRFPSALGGVGWWPATTAILLALTAAGAALRRGHAWLLVPGALGLLVSGSTATAPGLRAMSWLSAHIPLVAAYREPGKWSALWLLAVVVLVAEAIAAAPAALRRPWLGPALAYAATLALLLPVGFDSIRNTASAVHPIGYPQDWTQAAAYLQAHVDDTTTVAILPWHQYEVLAFTGGRLTVNPAAAIFPGDLIVPDDPEIAGATPPPSPHGALGALAERAGDRSCALAAALRDAGARWVVVENATGAQAITDRLLPCGFARVEGAPGITSVLHG